MKTIFISIFIFAMVLGQKSLAAGIEVTGAQFKKDQYLSYNFGEIDVNGFRAATFRITNTSDEAIDFVDLTIRGIMFDAYSNCPDRMQAKQVCYLRVFFRPFSQGYFSGRVYMSFSDHENIDLHLLGSARRNYP